jgi:hypothetical protein
LLKLHTLLGTRGKWDEKEREDMTTTKPKRKKGRRGNNSSTAERVGGKMNQ